MKGRQIVVTGGSGALGKVVVATLQAAGATVHDASLERGVDISDERAVVGFYDALPSVWASVHLAGGFAMAPITETSLAAFRAQHDLNVVTCFLACREAIRAMRRGGQGGRIVNVAARPVLVPAAGMAAYAAAKAGVAALTQTLAKELVDDQILVNAVVPSLFDTPANRASMPDADHAKWPKPEEIAAAIAFLVSPENRLTSGTLLPVYGRV
jgi:NAD(P)-dependent dehydrogenase (short-subunit alcohol dehydrogenase family)